MSDYLAYLEINVRNNFTVIIADMNGRYNKKL